LLSNGPDNGRLASPAYTVVFAPHSVTGSATEQPATPRASNPVVHLEPVAATQTQSAAWQEAERARDATRSGLAAHLREWLKQKFVRRLIADRASLLESHQTASAKAVAIDERLARIESQIQQQTQAYERRIEELTHELLAAKDENRDLIRARIHQVKTEMEAARARLLGQVQRKSGEGRKPPT
jgi:hypothetical protein